MSDEILSKQALDVLNRAGEIMKIVDFCGAGGRMTGELRQFMGWLGEHLRSELSREAFEEPELEVDEDGVALYLFSPTWRLPEDGDYVAFALWWPYRFWEEQPCVELCVPSQESFPLRNELLERVRPKLKRAGFTDFWEEEGDPDPGVPLWKNISLTQFHRDSGFNLGAVVAEIANSFRCLLEVEPLIENAMQAMPQKPAPPPAERTLKTIAFLDTESEGLGPARKMTELAIVSTAYDPAEDAVVGVLEEYFKDAMEALDEKKARAALDRADFIVAHNGLSADKPLVDRHLPTEKKKWLCSYKGIAWKQLMGVQSESLETLMGKAGLRYEQDHNARADARDLKRLLSVKHKGRTYLGRLLDNAQAAE